MEVGRAVEILCSPLLEAEKILRAGFDDASSLP